MKTFRIQNQLSRRVVFIVVTSILLGLLQSVNFLMISVIGFGAVYTSIVTLLISMYLLIKMYKYYFERDMNFINAALLSIPIFFFMSIINFFLIDYDYDNSVTYEYYANGYFIYVIEESAKQFIPVILFFIMIFYPTNRLLNRKRNSINN